MNTNFFLTNFVNTPQGPGRPGKVPGTSQVPSLRNPRKTNLRGRRETFRAPSAPHGRRPPHPAISGSKESPLATNPVLLFPGLFENTKENVKNTKDFSRRANPQKPCKTSRKHSKKTRKFPGWKRPKGTGGKEKF